MVEKRREDEVEEEEGLKWQRRGGGRTAENKWQM